MKHMVTSFPKRKVVFMGKFYRLFREELCWDSEEFSRELKKPMS